MAISNFLNSKILFLIFFKHFSILIFRPFPIRNQDDDLKAKFPVIDYLSNFEIKKWLSIYKWAIFALNSRIDGASIEQFFYISGLGGDNEMR